MNVPKCLCVFLCVVVSVNAQCADNTTMLAAALKGKVAHPSCSTFTKYCSYSSIGNACKRSCGHCGGSSGGKGSSSGGKGGSSSSGSCKDNNAALKSALGGKMGGNPSCSMVKLYCTQKGIGSKLVSARWARFVQISSSGTGVGRQVSGSPYLLCQFLMGLHSRCDPGCDLPEDVRPLRRLCLHWHWHGLVVQQADELLVADRWCL